MNIVSTSFGGADYYQSPINITRLNVVANVDESGIITVTEDFDVQFNKSNLHEVTRYIPYACYQYREIEGKVEKDAKYAKISNISGIGEYGETLNTYVDEVNGYITIGMKDSAGFALNSIRTYQISYTYNTGNDNNKGFDDVYFNLVGTNSTCEVRNVTFSVTLPNAEDCKSIDVYFGYAGVSEVLDHTVSGNTINGEISKLEAGEGITFRAVFADNYFKTQRIKLNTRQIIAIVLCLVCVVLAVVCFFVLRQKNNYPKPVELVPFEGLDPFVADYMSNQKISTKTISASVICLANNGYLTIEETDKKSIVFHKTTKDISEEKNTSLRAVYNVIFDGGKTDAPMAKLGSGFAESVTAIQSAEKIKQKTSLYNSKVDVKYTSIKLINLILMFVTALVVFNIPKSFFGFSTNLFNFVNIFWGVFIVYSAVLCFFNNKNVWIYNVVSSGIFTTCLICAYIRFNIQSIDAGCIGLIVLVVLSLLPIFMNIEPLYSKNGAITKGRVLGFKNYIQLCEVEQIKMFVSENPNYYFDVLPYAYVFGLTNVWMEKFKTIEVKMPEWLLSDTSSVWDYVLFNSMFMRFNTNLNRNINVHKTTMISNSIGKFTGGSGASSGGFGGGGFSGGGSGGGGFGAR